MRIISSTGTKDIATVYTAENSDGKLIELVESVQPPMPIEKKWVIIISTMFGCPVNCAFCDAGGNYSGNLTEEEMFFQIKYLIRSRWYEHKVDTDKFKIQFSRIGEPALNKNVLNVLGKLQCEIRTPCLMPSISTVAPKGSESFLKSLTEIKNSIYRDKFQMQFSIHSTNKILRDSIIPVRKLSFNDISDFGKYYFKTGDRKITLNFALAKTYPLEPEILLKYFPAEIFCLKITPVNPTFKAVSSGLVSEIGFNEPTTARIDRIRDAGYDVIISLGESEENKIGSNCGQYLNTNRDVSILNDNSYTYKTDILD